MLPRVRYVNSKRRFDFNKTLLKKKEKKKECMLNKSQHLVY